MTPKETQDAIVIIKRMDLKVAVPSKFVPHTRYEGSVTTDVTAQYIHVPSVIAMLEFEIQQANRRVDDIKKATAILLDIKREANQGKE